jgi:hypothetical protein
METFIEGVSSQTAGELALMIQDNLRAHHNPGVIASWNDHNISPEFLPPQSARFASVLDRSIFSVTKSRLKHIRYSTIEEKKAAVDQVIKDLPPDMVKKMWKKCGYKLRTE